LAEGELEVTHGPLSVVSGQAKLQIPSSKLQ
jgi:hypothetical protein